MSLSPEELKQLLEWAMEWALGPLERAREGSPITSDRTATSIEDHKEEYAFAKLAEETFPVHDLEVDPKDLKMDLLSIVQDLAFESVSTGQIDPHFPVDESIETDGLVATFQAKLNSVTASVGQGDYLETTFYFPLNVSWDSNKRSIKIFDITLNAISESEWSDQLALFANYPDTNGEDVVRSECKDTESTFWKTKIQSKGRTYAAKKLEASLRLLCAKFNFSKYRWNTSLLHERTSYSVTTPRWSRIQHPFAVLIKGEDCPLETSIISKSSFEPVEIDWSDQEFLDAYDQFSELSYDTDESNRIFQDSLLEYQKALVSEEMHESFFGFWRCIEGLSQVEYGKKSDITDRALWSLEVCKSDGRSAFVETIADQLYSRRNSWVHEPNWDDVWKTHERIAKYLADAMIQLYLSELFEYEKGVISEIFNHATMAPPQRDSNYQQAVQRQQAIESLREIETD